MMYVDMPAGFEPRFEIVSCFCGYRGKVLLLLRQDHKPQGNTWGVPAGKMHDGESREQAVRRELGEETGYTISLAQFVYFRTVYVRYPEYDFIYHIFSASVPHPEVRINPREHKRSQWAAPEEALHMNLIPDLGACIRLVYGL